MFCSGTDAFLMKGLGQTREDHPARAPLAPSSPTPSPAGLQLVMLIGGSPMCWEPRWLCRLRPSLSSEPPLPTSVTVPTAHPFDSSQKSHLVV